VDLKLITAPTEEPVTLATAQEHLRNTDDQELGSIRQKLKAATDFCQRRISGHRQFMPATYELVLEDFPGADRDEEIELPRPPLQSVTHIKYYDDDGTLQTVSTGDYNVITPSDDPGYVEPAFGETWPTTRSRSDAVTVRFSAGYASRAKVPETIKEAILLKLEHLWDPERVKEADISRAIDDLLGCNTYGHYG